MIKLRKSILALLLFAPYFLRAAEAPKKKRAKVESRAAKGKKGTWSPGESARLAEIVASLVGSDEKMSYSDLSKGFNEDRSPASQRSAKQCRERWNNHLRVQFNKVPLTREE